MNPDESGDLLTLNRVRVEFGTLVAVRDVSFSLRGGDLLGLIGPNGAGKTTLLRAITGLQPLACGAVDLLGQRMTPHAFGLMHHIGFTPDTPPVYDGLTVREFLQFVAKGYDLNHEQLDEVVNFWLEQVWLREKADQKIKTLSRGMRQRIGIARTLLPNPEVILLDEPAAGLDPGGRVQFRQLLCNLRDQGKALIVSSHILADMSEYCTHIAIMDHGAILRFGTVAEVTAHDDGRQCRYTILLTRPMAELKEILMVIPGVSGVAIDRDRATFTFDSGRDQAAELLARLIRQRVPVAAFSPHRADIEEAYLRAGIQQVD